jgi:hypothetical protein
VPAPATPVVPGVATPVHDRKAKAARGYVWETFRKHNFMSVRNGASSQRIFGPLARELADGLLEACPDLADVRYAAAVTRWSEAEAQESLMVFELDRVVDAEGVGSERAEQLERRLDRVRARSARLRQDLGLTPRGHVELVAGRAHAEHEIVDLEGLRRRGREAIEARTARDDEGAP